MKKMVVIVMLNRRVFVNESGVRFSYVTDVTDKNDTTIINAFVPNNTHILKVPSSIDSHKVIAISSSITNPSNVKKIIIPGSINTIKFHNFSYLQNLESVVIKEGVKVIESYAFKECANLKRVVLPSSINFIYSDAFDACNKDLLLRVNKYSFAEKFAKQYGIKCSCETSLDAFLNDAAKNDCIAK